MQRLLARRTCLLFAVGCGRCAEWMLRAGQHSSGGPCCWWRHTRASGRHLWAGTPLQCAALPGALMRRRCYASLISQLQLESRGPLLDVLGKQCGCMWSAAAKNSEC